MATPKSFWPERLYVELWDGKFWVAKTSAVLWTSRVAGPFESREAAQAAKSLMESSL